MRAPWWSLLGAALALAGCTRGGGPADLDRDGFPAGIDCDDADSAAYTAVVVYLDEDGDGVGAGPAQLRCTDGRSPPGSSLLGTDCAPVDPAAWRLVAVPPVDRDGDGATAPDPVVLCVGATLPAPYLQEASGNDCDDADPARSTWVSLYQDLDGDGVGAGPRSIECLGAALPAGWTRRGGDLDDLDPAVSAGLDDDDLLRLID